MWLLLPNTVMNLSPSCPLPTPNPEFPPGSVCSATKGNCSALFSVPHTEVQRGWTPGNRKRTWFKLCVCDQCLGSNILHFIKLLSSGRFWEQPPSRRLQIICKQDLTTWKLRFLFFFGKLRLNYYSQILNVTLVYSTLPLTINLQARGHFQLLHLPCLAKELINLCLCHSTLKDLPVTKLCCLTMFILRKTY